VLRFLIAAIAYQIVNNSWSVTDATKPSSRLLPQGRDIARTAAGRTAMDRKMILPMFTLALFLNAPPPVVRGDSNTQQIANKKCPTVQIKGPKTVKGAKSIVYRGVVKNFPGGRPALKWSFEGALIVRGEGTDVITVQPIATTVKPTLLVENVPNGCRPSTASLKTEITDVWVHPPPVISRLILSPSLITRSCPAGTRSESCPATINEVNVAADVAVNSPGPAEEAVMFTWAVTTGRLIGSGRTVRWDLSGVANGLYTIIVEVDYFGAKATGSASLRITDCNDCKPMNP
jgi:hypothetical protein